MFLNRVGDANPYSKTMPGLPPRHEGSLPWDKVPSLPGTAAVLH